MIPKILHYCWFGGNVLPDSVIKLKKTWKKYCPDYEIKEWNETNFDVRENVYCKEAYEAHKWAFVSDYVRLKVLHEFGGFYLDTDVEVLKSLDPLRKYNAVSGFESDHFIPTGTMAAVPNNEWIALLLHDYDNRHFKKEDGSYDLTTNVEVITRLTKESYHLKLNGEKVVFGNNIALLPFDYLCAKSWKTGKIMKTENTFTIHHFNGSWLSETAQKKMKLRRLIAKILNI